MYEFSVELSASAPRDRQACLELAERTGVLALHQDDADIILGGGTVQFTGLGHSRATLAASTTQHRTQTQEKMTVDFEDRVSTFLAEGMTLDAAIDKAATEHPAEFRAWDAHLRGTLAENPDIVEESAKLAAEDPRSGKR